MQIRCFATFGLILGDREDCLQEQRWKQPSTAASGNAFLKGKAPADSGNAWYRGRGESVKGVSEDREARERTEHRAAWALKEEESDPEETAFTRAGNSNYFPFLTAPHKHTLTVHLLKPFFLIHKDDHSLYETNTTASQSIIKPHFSTGKLFPTKTDLSSPFGSLQIQGKRSPLV